MSVDGCGQKIKHGTEHETNQESKRLAFWARAGNVPFLMVIYVYRATLSPFMGGQCRFVPTCSRYGLEAYKVYGPIRGTIMTGKRILRCNPFSKGGYDPVPISSDGRSCGHEHRLDDQTQHESEREKDEPTTSSQTPRATP